LASYDGNVGRCSLQAADMDGDGQLDLLCAGMDVFTAWMGNPDGTFQPAKLLDGEGIGSTLLVGDVTGDGRPDVMGADSQGPVGVWENTCP
jgi:hypothetical protein